MIKFVDRFNRKSFNIESSNIYCGILTYEYENISKRFYFDGYIDVFVSNIRHCVTGPERTEIHGGLIEYYLNGKNVTKLEFLMNVATME